MRIFKDKITYSDDKANGWNVKIRYIYLVIEKGMIVARFNSRKDAENYIYTYDTRGRI